ncbi:MAG: hypothetical protein QNJ14_12690 [Woeseiaceae bacterium]|nr:hypothetical protein [Woeseiaceae bacterium]
MLLLISIPMLAAWRAEPQLAVWGTAFALLGLHFVTRVRRLDIEPGLRTVRYRSGYVVPFLSTAYPYNAIREVRLVVRIKKRGNKHQRSFWLVFRGEDDQTVCRLRGVYFARSIGEQIAALLNVPLVDSVSGMGQKRAARDLETPLVEIWNNRGQRFEPAQLPPGTALVAHESPDGFLLRFAPQGRWGKIVPAIAGTFLLPVLGAVAGVDSLAFATSEFYLVFAAWCAGMLFMSLAFAARSSLRISRSRLTYRQGLFPIRQSMPLTDIEQWVTAFDGIHLIGDRRQVFVQFYGNAADRAYTRDALRYHLRRLGEAVAGDRKE